MEQLERMTAPPLAEDERTPLHPHEGETRAQAAVQHVVEAVSTYSGVDISLPMQSDAAIRARMIAIGVLIFRHDFKTRSAAAAFGCSAIAGEVARGMFEGWVASEAVQVKAIPLPALVELFARHSASQSAAGFAQAHLTVAEIIRVVADTFGVHVRDVISERRSAHIIDARQAAMWLCRRLTHHSLPAIGQRFGGRDHTTVMHAVRKIGKLNPDLPDPRETGLAAMAEILADRAHLFRSRHKG